LNPAEISEVIAEVCSETTSNQSNAPSRLTTQSRQPSADVAFSVLIKLVIDMYMILHPFYSFALQFIHCVCKSFEIFFSTAGSIIGGMVAA
jgi:hypothetical protein